MTKLIFMLIWGAQLKRMYTGIGSYHWEDAKILGWRSYRMHHTRYTYLVWWDTARWFR